MKGEEPDKENGGAGPKALNHTLNVRICGFSNKLERNINNILYIYLNFLLPSNSSSFSKSKSV